MRDCPYKGGKLDILGAIEVTSKAGYSGIEPWINQIDAYVNAGGTLTDLRKRIADAGLVVESPLFIHGPDGEYTPDLLRAYGTEGF